MSQILDAPANNTEEKLGEENPFASSESAAEEQVYSPGGMREVLALAVPMAISTSTYAILQLTDRLFMAWYSEEGVAATLSGGVLVWVFMCLPFGVAGYVQTFIAQYLGAKREKEIGAILAQGMWVGIATIPIFACVIPIAPLFYMGQEASLAAKEVTYFRISLVGAPAVVLAAALGAFFNGRGKPNIEMTSSLIATVVNIALDYSMIFGKWGFPEMGVAGAAWSTIIAQWLKVFILLFFVYTPATRREYGVTLMSGLPNWRLLWRLLYYGVPAGMQYFVETSTFTLLVFFIRGEGRLELAATSLALSLNMFAFTPVFGVGTAVSALVGKYLGQNQPQYAARSTWSAMWLALGFTLICAVLYFGFPDFLFAAHQMGVDGQDNALALSIAKGLLKFAALYCMLDAAQVIFVSALRGAGDTAFVFIVSTCIPLFAVTMGRVLRPSIDAWNITGVHWWWSIVTLWLLLLCLVFGARFLHGKWKSMRVIEPEVIL